VGEKVNSHCGMSTYSRWDVAGGVRVDAEAGLFFRDLGCELGVVWGSGQHDGKGSEHGKLRAENATGGIVISGV
jgi:hypothetical protein